MMTQLQSAILAMGPNVFHFVPLSFLALAMFGSRVTTSKVHTRRSK